MTDPGVKEAEELHIKAWDMLKMGRLFHMEDFTLKAHLHSTSHIRLL